MGHDIILGGPEGIMAYAASCTVKALPLEVEADEYGNILAIQDYMPMVNEDEMVEIAEGEELYLLSKLTIRVSKEEDYPAYILRKKVGGQYVLMDAGDMVNCMVAYLWYPDGMEIE